MLHALKPTAAKSRAGINNRVFMDISFAIPKFDRMRIRKFLIDAQQHVKNRADPRAGAPAGVQARAGDQARSNT
jgi:hypothetical protein